MTLGTTHSILRYDGDGATTSFAVTFEFHDVNDLEVIVVTRETGAEVLKSFGADYSVAGGNGGTGTVTMNVAPTTAERIAIRRISPDMQPDDLIDGGALAAEPLERRLDIIAARLQELETDIARSLKVAKGNLAPESGLTLNLTGGMGSSLQVASNEQGIILAASVAPEDAVLSTKGEELVGLPDEPAMRLFLGLTSAATTALGTSGATVPLLNGSNTHSGANTFSGDATFNSDVTIGAPLILGSETLAITSNAITPTKSAVLLSNTSFLDEIGVASYPVGAIIKISMGAASQTATLRHDQGGGNIYLDDDADVILDDRDKTIWLQRRDSGQGEHGSGWYEIGRSFKLLPTGSIVRTWRGQTTTEFEINAATPTHAIPADDTVPQSGEGVEVLSVPGVTPQFATSKLLITVTVPGEVSGNAQIIAALFDGGTDAVAATVMNFVSSGSTLTNTVQFLIDAVNTDARTLSLRIGPATGTAVFYVNWDGSTSNLLGTGMLKTVMIIQEIVA